ncbi:hypothetical protein LCGC14_3004070, partial [marine sediment metagenome]
RLFRHAKLVKLQTASMNAPTTSTSKPREQSEQSDDG